MKILVDGIYPKLTDKMMERPELLTFRHPRYPIKSGIYFGLLYGKLYARELDSLESVFDTVNEIKTLLKLDEI